MRQGFVRSVQNAIAGGFAALWLASTPAPVVAQDAAELMLRLDRIEAENRRLTGQVEELTFQLRRLEEQIRRVQADADLRFRDIEAGRGGARVPSAPALPAAPSTPPGGGRRSDAFDPAANTGAPGAPRPLGTPGTASPPLPGGGSSAGVRVSPDTLGAPLDVTGKGRPPGPPVPMGRGDPASDFAYAKSLVDRGDYETAEGALRDFLRAHAKNRRVPEATFLLGESYLRRTRYREAAEQFLAVTSKFSNASRAPESMLKLAIALRGIGANQEACGTLAQLPRKYPGANTAILQAAERERARAQC